MSTPARRRSRIAHFKAPFLVGIAGAAVGLGCGGRTPTEERDNRDDAALASGESQSPLPTGTPAPGSTCAAPAPAPTNYGCGTSSPICVDGEWQVPVTTCNPPPPGAGQQPQGCPEQMPIAGSDCTRESLRPAVDDIAWNAFAPPPACRYSGCEGPTSSTATCVGGQWLVHYSTGPACNPPAVIPVCPEAALVAGNVCAYEGQSCSVDCTSHICTGGTWQLASTSCPAVDAGTPVLADAGP